MLNPARIPFGAGLFLLAACSDSGTLPSRMPSSQPERGSRSPNSSSREYVIGVKQRGRLQRYHVRVDKRAQALTINSIGMCNPDVPDTCSACGPNSPECMGPITTVNEPLDYGRVFVGDVFPSESLPVADCPLTIR